MGVLMMRSQALTACTSRDTFSSMRMSSSEGSLADEMMRVMAWRQKLGLRAPARSVGCKDAWGLWRKCGTR